jgi:hypothetical protein
MTVRKIALKRLRHSDLTLFRSYFSTHPVTSKQKAINLDAAILIRQFYPELYNTSIPTPVQVALYGPGPGSRHQVGRRIRKQAKNWRLDGALIEDPRDEQSVGYDTLLPDDLAVMEFTDGPDGLPTNVNLILVSAVHEADRAAYGLLDKLLKDRSMISLTAELTTGLLRDLPAGHPVTWLLADQDLASFQDLIVPAASGIDVLLPAPGPLPESVPEDSPQRDVFHNSVLPLSSGRETTGDFAGIDFETVTPEAAAFVETLRAIGYSPETAIADLVDNSIAASASTILIDFHWAGPDSTMLLTDDGHGMSEPELVNAMRPGSKNPLQERSAADLGRFGMGLKTASFSQCRRLTVLSRPLEGAVSYRCWDLNHIGQTGNWHLLKWASTPAYTDILRNMKHGTVVVWELADRLAGGLLNGRDKDLAKFNQLIERIQWHLEMTFHRFLQRGLVIKINGACLEPWDPFLAGRKGTQRLPEEEPAENVVVRPYILPHHRMFATDDEYHAAARIRGWNGHQGFYVYRNDRLLVAGDWLGLCARDEHHRLARIAVSIPASLDQEWQIDIRKARAWPPHYMRERLRAIAAVTRRRAADVYRSRGQRVQSLQGSDLTSVWLPEVKEGRTRYRINREHPALLAVLEELAGTPSGTGLKDVLRLLEECLPSSQIALTVSEANGAEEYAFDDEGEALELMSRIYRQKRARGASPDEARQYVSCIDPFHRKPNLLKQLTD